MTMGDIINVLHAAGYTFSHASEDGNIHLSHPDSSKVWINLDTKQVSESCTRILNAAK